MNNLFFLYPIYGERGFLFFGTETTQREFNKLPFTNEYCRHICVDAAVAAGISLPTSLEGKRVTEGERTLLLREGILQPNKSK